MTTTIYVASAVEQMLLVEHYVEKLKRLGFAIGYEWTHDVRESGFKPDVELSHQQRRFIAKMDSRGVEESGLVWVITPGHKHQGCGMWVELGMALALRKRVVVSGPLARRTVFTELAEAVFDSHDQAFDYISSRHEAA
ncbi:MAG: hypothetical protein EBT03_09260 [Betaproteobacteria bacterium]|nr:hypothetical protein [Betaproteobacteria bacterium]